MLQLEPLPLFKSWIRPCLNPGSAPAVPDVGGAGKTQGCYFAAVVLDDGTNIAPCHSAAAFLDQVVLHGPKYCLLLNPKKCELYWPNGDDTFPEFPSDVKRLTELRGDPS